jgi:hypothetical protein
MWVIGNPNGISCQISSRPVMLIALPNGALSVTNPGKGDNVHSQVIFLNRQKIPNTNGVYFK